MSDSSQPHHEPHGPGSHFQPPLGVVLTIVILFVAATFFMLRSPSPNSPASTTTVPGSVTTTTHPRSTVVPKSRVRVQVANGTQTPNLARTYTQKLLTLGWDTLPQLNGPRVNATVIYFNPGYKWAALAIATEVHLTAKSVQPLGGQNPVTGSHTDDVIVILGPDLAIAG